MNGNSPRFVRLGLGVIGLVALGCVLTGLAAKPARRGIALPTDWSHSHLIFSQPASLEQVGHLEEDPRFEQQLYRRYQALRLPAAPPDSDVSSSQMQLPRSRRSGGLWEENMGTNATVGAVNFPAKFSFTSGVANCGSAATPDFVVYSTGLTGSGTQASLVAYDNLYAGCTAPVPAVYWAYNTGGQILTSPEFSRDGTQVMFVQTSGGVGSLVLLKWAPSLTETVSSPGVPTSVLPAGYAACVAACMTTFPLKDGSSLTTNDTTSSVFYDYGGDTGWVGDSRGWVHRFNPVLTGTPAEVRTAPWPVQVNALGPLPLASAVYDHGSGNVFVGDAGGFFYSVSAATGTVTASGRLDRGTGIVAGPLVDSSAGLAYVFASNDGSAACAGAACAAVYRFASGFGAGTTGAKVTVGASSGAPKPLYEGALDSAYESSVNATGNLYVCGHTGARPTLYQVQIKAGGVLGAVRAGPVLSGSNTGCSPVSNVLNPNAAGGTTEFIFASAQTNGTSTPCAGGGCIMNFKDTPWQPSTTYTVGQEIVDSNFHVQMVFTAGTSGAAEPATWSVSLGAPPLDQTTDGTVTWVNLGLTSAATPAAWVANHVYAIGNHIADSNQNIEVVTAIAGNARSGGAAPAWSASVGQTTADFHVTWTNAGPAPSALPSSGGTSGVIIDNTVVGAISGSQVYFSTQGNQTCTPGSGGNGGCAVQASQSALK